jgi:hypothetical protein
VGLVRRLQWPLAELWHALSTEVGSMTRSDAIIRRQVLKAGLIVAGVPFCPEALFDRRAVADDEKPAEDTPIGLREIIKDLAKDVKDEDLKKRILAKVYRLTATN